MTATHRIKIDLTYPEATTMVYEYTTENPLSVFACESLLLYLYY